MDRDTVGTETPTLSASSGVEYRPDWMSSSSSLRQRDETALPIEMRGRFPFGIKDNQARRNLICNSHTSRDRIVKK